MGFKVKRKKTLKEGDTVRVNIPTHVVETGDTITPKMAEKFNDIEARISRKKTFSATHTYYELEGIETEHGVAYAFLAEWLEETNDNDATGF